MFCSWGAEEYGLIGSVEYVQVYTIFKLIVTTNEIFIFQEYVKVLGARVVSYLNMDIAVEGNTLVRSIIIISSFYFSPTGNYTIHAKASPLLFDIIVEASKMVKVFLIKYDKFSLIFDIDSKCI